MLNDDPLVLLFAGLFGLVIGSFLNVIIHRLPRRLDAELAAACRELADEAPDYPSNRWFGLAYLLWPGSHCPACERPIRAWENIPLLSYLIQRGRCTGCATAIPVRYPLVELLSGLLTVVVIWRFGPGWQGLAAAVLTWGLVALSVIDLQRKLLPDVLTLPLLWLGLLLNLDGLFAPLPDAVLGAVVGYGFLWLVYHLFLLATGKEGMGYGDFKLLAAFGAWFGWTLVPQIILLASLAGAVIGLSMIALRQQERGAAVPFGPYLAIAGWIALLWGPELNALYLGQVGLLP